MTAAEREATRLELNRALRDRDPTEAVGLRLLDRQGDEGQAEHGKGPATLGGFCRCGALLLPGDLSSCDACRQLAGGDE